MTIEIPQLFVGGSATLLATKASNYDSNEKVTIDMTSLKFADSVGMNYLILIPFLFKNKNIDVEIVLSDDTNILQFLKYTSILDILQDNFAIKTSRRGLNFTDSKSDISRNTREDLFFALGANPFLRTYLTKTMYDYSLLMRFRKELIDFGAYSNRVTNKVSSCLIELIQNIFDHSQQSVGALSIRLVNESPQYVGRKHIQISVTDLGIGIKESFKKTLANDFPLDFSHPNFLSNVVEKGVTSTGNPSRGMGLYVVSKVCDSMQILSGDEMLSLKNTMRGAKHKTKSIDYLQGTSINCSLTIENEYEQ